MKISVCFQVVYEFRSQDDLDPELILRTEPSGPFSRVTDAYDECALEMALRIRDRNPDVELTAVTVSPHDDKRIFESLYALGFDRIIRADYEAPSFHPMEKAAILAPLVKDADLILTGKQSSLGGSRQVPRELARLLQRPYVDHVNHVELTEKGIYFEAAGEGAVASGVVKNPAVLMAGDSAWLRIPTLRNRLAVKNKAAVVMPASGCEAGDRPPERIEKIKERGSCVWLTGTVQEQAEKILSILEGEGKKTLTKEAESRKNVRFAYGGKLAAVFAEELPEQKPVSVISPDWIEDYVSRPDDTETELSEASAVLVAGRGLGTEENRILLAEAAEALDARIAATRAAVLNGWYPAGLQVGISGVMLHSEKEIVFGASGAAAFTNGIDSCKCVIAVNRDPNAGIFRHADYGCVADCGVLLKALKERLDRRKETEE